MPSFRWFTEQIGGFPPIYLGGEKTTAQEKEVRYITENDPGYKVAFVDGIVGSLGGTGGRLAFYVDIPV